MSGSEDGQLRSPGDELLSDDEHDTDSLDIKPPQVNYTRDSNGGGGGRRKEDRKAAKDKRHSKERRHREHSGREHDRDIRSISGGALMGDRERRGELERRVDHRRDEVEQRYHHRSAYDDNRDPMDRRYQKHYERNSEVVVAVGGSRGGGSYHYQQQQQPQPYHHQAQQLHMPAQRQDYYEQRNQSYHHSNSSSSMVSGGRAAVEYYSSSRHQSYVKHAVNLDENYELQQRERRKYHYEHSSKDAESLEQDLRSRLISKRHKYVKSNGDDDDDEQYEMRHEYERTYEERERKMALMKSERRHHEKQQQRDNVIEVLDSPDILAAKSEPHQKRNKHKRHHKEKLEEEVRIKRRVTADDPELLARREKFLAAEREKEKRKEELEMRREQRRGRKDMLDTLSPSAVAASVTAGLNVVVVKRKSTDAHEHHGKQKRSKRTKDVSDDDMEDSASDEEEEDDDEDEIDEDEDDESDSSSDSATAVSEKSFHKESKKTENKQQQLESNDEIELPDSPLSIGELSKSSYKHNNEHATKKHSSTKHSRRSGGDSDHSNSRSISLSRSRSRSPSKSNPSSKSRSRTRSRSHSSRSGSSQSRSRSRSPHSAHSRHSRSASRHYRSRSGSAERDLHPNKEEAEGPSTAEQEAVNNAIDTKKKNTIVISSESPVRDEKGVPLPNYYPGVQGCRSVEEFQYLNRIEEGTYGVVYRARDKRTNEIVALKRLKMEKEKEGFPITSLREINTLLKGQHPNIVTVREIVCSNMDMIFIVMDYVEHDLKSLMETMKTRKQSFFPAEVKCLTQQLLRAVAHLHDNWILHRDLKTSNLLLSHKGILKVGDFGLAREYGSPLKQYTSLVVTLWYRAPELLLCSPEYSTPIDVWSVGCIFAEFLQMAPLFPGRSEIDEITRIFKELGTPNEKIWPGYLDLPAVKNLMNQNSTFPDYPASSLRKRFNDKTSDAGIALLQGLLTYDPKQRLTAEAALNHPYFKELPPPIDPSMFPTWPAKSEMGTRKTIASSPKPPSGGSQFKQLGRDDIIPSTTTAAGSAGGGAGSSGQNKVVTGIITGNKKTATNTGFVLNSGVDQRQLAMGPGFSLRF